MGLATTNQAPLYRLLAKDPRVELTVIFGSKDGVEPFDMGYGKKVAWGADLTSGYDHRFLKAADRTPGLGEHFAEARNWDIVPELIRERFDVLWMGGYYSLTFVMAALTQRALGGEVFFRDEQTVIDRRSRANTIAKQLVLRRYFGSGWGLYISSENRRWLESYGVPDERLFACPYSVDNEAFQAAAAELRPRREELRRKLGITDDAGPVIVSVSRLIPKKNPVFALDVFREVRAQSRCTLLVVGTGPMEEELRQKVEREGIPDVVFTGFLDRSEINDAYAAADVFTLLSSEMETFGLVINEAMNFSLPVVASDRVGCTRDLVSTDYNGFVVSPHDPTETAAALTRLVGDAELRERMGAASLERISKWGPEESAAGVIAAAEAAVPEERRR